MKYTTFIETGGTKLCNVCKEVKPVSEFYQTTHAKDGYLSRCKGCHRAAVIERQKQAPEITNAATRRWKKRHREQVRLNEKRRLADPAKRSKRNRRHDLWKLYEVTPEWYEDKWKEQHEACGICGAKDSGALNRRPSVDHNHETGENRGILCHRCNTCLHVLELIPDWPEKARAYLAHYKEQQNGAT